MSQQCNSKVCHLTSVHKANDVRIFHKECKTLAESGYDVVLIAPHERDDVIGKVRIRRLDKPQNRRERMYRIVWQVYRAAMKEKANLYHIHDPELIPVGLLLKIFNKSKVIYDIHEDYPNAILSKPWIPLSTRKAFAFLFKLFEVFIVRFFDAVIPATRSIAKRFESLNKKTVTIQNFPIPNEQGLNKNKVPWHKRLNAAAYVGGIGALRGAMEMIEAIELVSQEFDASLILAGNFSSSLIRDEVKNLTGWGKVCYKGFISRKSMVELLGEVKVGLLLYHPEPNHIYAQPNKLFEYMSAGIPVIASNFPSWCKIVNDVGCGLTVDPLNPWAIAAAIIFILENPKEAEQMGKRGQHAVRNKYNWNVESQKFLALYDEILN
jgi:glycosyltransferase involved in cell wall biosynthesis